MTKAVTDLNPAAGRAVLSPEMARLRIEYVARAKRNSMAYDRLRALPEDSPQADPLERVWKNAVGSLRDIENQIFEQPIRTLADALFVLRLILKREGGCASLPDYRDVDEAAHINALRFINNMLDDDTSLGGDGSGDDADDWLSSPPYVEEMGKAMAAE